MPGLLAARAASVAFLLLLPGPCIAQEGAGKEALDEGAGPPPRERGEEPGREENPPAGAPAGTEAAKLKGSQLPGFVYVPAGLVHPGCTHKEYEERHRGNTELRKALLYDVWGSVPPFPIGAFHIGRYEVTNAQWKEYLDRNFRVEHEAQEGETLKALASRYVKFRGEGVESEWKAIYGLNWRALVEAWRKEEKWGQGWAVADPPAGPGDDVGVLPIPKGTKLVLYAHRVPYTWYGWCKLAGLGVGREYCEPAKPAAEAFVVPDGEPFASIPLRDKDFAAYPVRAVSPAEILAFAEWAGCQLPNEYEWERAARGDNLRWPFAFGPWDYGKQKTIVAWAENERARQTGPLRVDDPSVSGSDSPFGARHMNGNVWELTRTFFDLHPRLSPKPPEPDLANYALTAKGGSFGDGWQNLWVCARTGLIGQEGELSLKSANRADSLGLRLVRHDDRPAYDLLLHSIRRLSYDAPAAQWSAYVPHAFAMERMAGSEVVKVADAQAPYIHFTDRAKAIAFAPLWVTTLDESARRSTKPERHKHFVLGAIRIDVPIRAGVRLSDADARALVDARQRFDKLIDAWKKLPKEKQQKIKKPEPPPDYEPDEYEKATAKNMAVWGMWREKTVPAGEWLLVYWNGFLGLANRTLTMPPDAIVMVPEKQIVRRNVQPEPAQLSLDAAKNEIRLRFLVWEQPTDKAKQVIPPPPEQSDEWALCDAYPASFVRGGAAARPFSWDVEVAFRTESGALSAWRSRPEEARDPADKPDHKKNPIGK